jgi:hypothetical protein
MTEIGILANIAGVSAQESGIAEGKGALRVSSVPATEGGA